MLFIFIISLALTSLGIVSILETFYLKWPQYFKRGFDGTVVSAGVCVDLNERRSRVYYQKDIEVQPIGQKETLPVTSSTCLDIEVGQTIPIVKLLTFNPDTPRFEVWLDKFDFLRLFIGLFCIPIGVAGMWFGFKRTILGYSQISKKRS